VDDTRELLDNVQYAPTRSRYKIYLIDEVHMLSTHSFNALLKTLEEPPPHVKFLLATTDPQKLPVTVLSRCLQFNLKRLSVALISARLTHDPARPRSIEFEPAAVQLLAQAGDGSLRDALSLLDQLLAFGNGKALEAMRVRCSVPCTRSCAAVAELLAAGDAAAAAGVRATRSMSSHPTMRSCSSSLRRCSSAWHSNSWCPTTRAMNCMPRSCCPAGRADPRRGSAAVLPDRDSRSARSGARSGCQDRLSE
jgi:DNA polymerase III subunit gamma/tau